ncbi:hypothetical protein BBJ29_000745 [Phytophthora kernoviae]|uniref:Uncharacterized protein n=1 Tax=Phytophthora kernoviae TaxID=325452 RepID=A0A3F2RWR7_9STRA|nr:hypothetical protein BBJ29_000745 [Phytophthora kernoviae]RLN65760.1 hypothetical protein BBP00_00002648 [Phytophthora kernoviae]
MHVKPSFFRSRQAPKKVPVTSWTTDHVETSGKSSLGVLLDWLAAPNNYTRWRSSNRSSESRRIVADEIVQLLHSAGLVHRTATQVVAKVTELERSYREAAERLASTKRELEEAQGTPAERNLHRVLERHCRYFALLQPIMKDKAVGPQPKKRPLLSTKRKAMRVQQPPRKTKTRVMESISVMQLEEEQEDRRIGAVRDLVQPAALRSIQEIDLEKARVELTLRQLEVQMARDKALVMRTKARSELLEQGVSRGEVDRLMPLDV